MIAVTGGAGFIGSNLMPALGDDAVVVEPDSEYGLDVLPPHTHTVVHLAANADVRGGWKNPRRDVQDNIMLTVKLLEAMRAYEVRHLVFASSGSVYHPAWHAHEETCETRATSLYAASKVACEQLISAYCAAGYLKSATVLRFVSVLGPHYSHGLIYDFVQKLVADPTRLEIIAPGTSRKSYVHVADVVNAITSVVRHPDSGFMIYNVGTAEVATPIEIGKWVIETMGLHARIDLVGETWVGDNPTIRLNTNRLQITRGWIPQHTVWSAVKETAQWLTS